MSTPRYDGHEEPLGDIIPAPKDGCPKKGVYTSRHQSRAWKVDGNKVKFSFEGCPKGKKSA